MAVRIRRYDAECIPQCGGSRATIDTTGYRHWVIIVVPGHGDLDILLVFIGG
jgi:hypothetical protein